MATKKYTAKTKIIKGDNHVKFDTSIFEDDKYRNTIRTRGIYILYAFPELKANIWTGYVLDAWTTLPQNNFILSTAKTVEPLIAEMVQLVEKYALSLYEDEGGPLEKLTDVESIIAMVIEDFDHAIEFSDGSYDVGSFIASQKNLSKALKITNVVIEELK